MTTENPSKVVAFPDAEERARRLRIEVERLSRMSTVEWMYYVETENYEKYGVDKAALKKMVEAVIKEAEKKQRDAQAELRRTEARAERKQDRAERQVRREEKQREEEAEKVAAKAEKKEREKQDAFASIIDLPSVMHEGRLAELAKRLGEDAEVLNAEFAVFADSTDRRRGDAIEPWPEPVSIAALLADVVVQFRRYIVVRDEEAVAVALWIMFAWVHDIATHSPILTFRAPLRNTGKTASCGVVMCLTPRAYAGGELTGPSLFRFVDRVHPTLIIDDADRLFKRKPDLAHVVNLSWTRNFKIPRTVNHVPVWFDPFCPKVIAGKKLVLEDTTESRTISIRLKRKLPNEEVEHFSYEDDEVFYALRRKLARFAADNRKALKKARPAAPAGFDNRLADNWRVMLAIADMAAGTYPKTARAAAIKLSAQAELEESVRLLSALREIFTGLFGIVDTQTEKQVHAEMLSKEIAQHLNADPTAEWCDFRGRGPIKQRQIAFLLKDFDIYPVQLRRSRLHGYRYDGQLADAFARYLPPIEKPRKGR